MLTRVLVENKPKNNYDEIICFIQDTINGLSADNILVVAGTNSMFLILYNFQFIQAQ